VTLLDIITTAGAYLALGVVVARTIHADGYRRQWAPLTVALWPLVLVLALGGILCAALFIIVRVLLWRPR
jgi:hypothetical protein